MLRLLLLLLPLGLWGQVVETMTCPSSATAGSQVVCPIALTSGSPSAAQGVVSINNGANPVGWTISTTVPGKQVSANPGNTNIFVIDGMNATIIPLGQMSAVTFTMPPSGNVTVGINSALASDPNGGALTITTNPPVTVSLQSNSKCDINGDGIVNQADVTVLRQQILAANTVSNVTTLQKVINAALGGTCTL